MRKSSDEGLQQDFNSLDAQREAAEAYIASQKAEGWVCLPDRYDDGGFTGGNMERPAVQRLMADIEAGKFVAELCKYPGDPRKIDEARRHILEAQRDRLVVESAENVAAGRPPVLDKSGRPFTKDTPLDQIPPPKVLDMFAGGGAIPLEALRLGCEAYALDLNPVAHIFQLCTLVYPQKYGKPDPSARGMTGPKNAQGETTWGGLADEVRDWGNWVLEKVRAEIGDLYPPIPDPQAKADEIGTDPQQHMDFAKDKQGRLAAHVAT